MIKLSVVLSTKNEEKNIGECLDSVKKIADEIIVFDEYSADKTKEIAEKHGAKVYLYNHKINFHETKQRAIDKAKGKWILQLDADERVSIKLASEISEVVHSKNIELMSRILNENNVDCTIDKKKSKLFFRHQSLIKQREGHLGKNTGEVVAFFIPRINYFLGKALVHAGAYPDGVIRLIKNGKARLPAKSVHELMEIDGEVGWLFNGLEHHESPTIERYFERMNRYTDYQSLIYKKKNISRGTLNLFKYAFIVPFINFFRLYIRHKGFLDGMRGFIWSVLSSLHYPLAYFKYYQNKNN